MRIAYLTNAYPAISHTFIRRELTQLERELGEIARYSIRRSPFELVDPDDVAENARTTHLMSLPASAWARAALRHGLGSPLKLARGLRTAVALGLRSHSGLPRHLAYFAEALVLLDELERREIDHVHVHFGTNPTAVAQITRAMGGPSYSFTVHGPDELDAPAGYKLGSKIRECAFVVAISHYCAAQLRRWVEHSHWEKIRIVHCSVGDDFFAQSAPIDPQSRSIVCVGRLSAQKGQLLLLEAFARALDQGVDAELVLAGDGEMREEIERLVRAKRIEGRVRITGWISGSQVRREILSSRALVLSSFAEGLPMVLMEAFALGRPVLATAIAGIPELVLDGVNGWLVPAGSVEALSDAIAAVLRTPASRLEEMAQRGREAVLARHRTQTEAAKLAEQIRRAMDGAATKRELG